MTSKPTTASPAFLSILEDSESRIELTSASAISSCDCQTKPMEDPAAAVGLVMHHAKTTMTRRLPIPLVVIKLLTQRVEEGDPTCIMVARWLDDKGLLDITCKNDVVGRVQ